jgi:hypothetical protein
VAKAFAQIQRVTRVRIGSTGAVYYGRATVDDIEGWLLCHPEVIDENLIAQDDGTNTVSNTP